MRSKIMNIVSDIFFALCIISSITIGILNNTWIYGLVVRKYNILQYTDLSYNSLMENYKILIDYLSNPFTKELVLKDFPMSTYGRIHFEEVKNIFMILSVITILFIIILLGMVIFSNNKMKIILDKLNGGCNVIITVVIFIFVSVIIDFSKTFELFHKIFFRNDYWIFDAVTDPIINVLPEKFFLIESIVLLGTLSIVVSIIKLIRIKKNKA